MSASLLSVPHVQDYGAWINFCLNPLIMMACIPLVEWLRQHRRDAQEKHKADGRGHVESLSTPVGLY